MTNHLRLGLLVPITVVAVAVATGLTPPQNNSGVRPIPTRAQTKQYPGDKPSLVEFVRVPPGPLTVPCGWCDLYLDVVNLRPADVAGSARVELRGRVHERVNRWQEEWVMLCVGSSVLVTREVPHPASVDGWADFSIGGEIEFDLCNKDQVLPIYVALASSESGKLATRLYESTSGLGTWRTPIGEVIARRPDRP